MNKKEDIWENVIDHSVVSKLTPEQLAMISKMFEGKK